MWPSTDDVYVKADHTELVIEYQHILCLDHMFNYTLKIPKMLAQPCRSIRFPKTSMATNEENTASIHADCCVEPLAMNTGGLNNIV